MITVNIQYYAIFREQRGQHEEQIETQAKTARTLYEELANQHGFTMPIESLHVVINEEFSDWNDMLNNDDTVVFIPPVAGG